jgi:hypothetical protein
MLSASSSRMAQVTQAVTAALGQTIDHWHVAQAPSLQGGVSDPDFKKLKD